MTKKYFRFPSNLWSCNRQFLKTGGENALPQGFVFFLNDLPAWWSVNGQASQEQQEFGHQEIQGICQGGRSRGSYTNHLGFSIYLIFILLLSVWMEAMLITDSQHYCKTLGAFLMFHSGPGHIEEAVSCLLRVAPLPFNKSKISVFLSHLGRALLIRRGLAE